MKFWAYCRAVMLVGIVLLIFREWFFSFQTLSHGDWPFFFPQAAREFTFSPAFYRSYFGLGESKLLFTGLETYFQSTARLFSFTSWAYYERIFWFLPFFIIAPFSSWYFTRSVVGILVFVASTYLLMVIGGGQVGVAIACALTPLVVGLFMRLVLRVYEKKKVLVRVVLLGVISGFQITIDPRIAYLSLLLCFSYMVYFFIFKRKIHFLWSREVIMNVVFLPITIAVSLNSYWILPLVRFGVSPTDHGNPSNFSLGSVSFFSFSDFSHAISLLHPNWPENLFGKVYFMQPEFLIVPLLAFLFLLFFNRREKNNEQITLFFFALIGLVGAFLAKGDSEPFGFVYRLLFQYFPGFVVFRDPTKFYLLVVLSYSFLIPKSIFFFSEFLKDRYKKNVTPIVEIVVILIFALLVHNAIFGQLGGTFRGRSVPGGYVLLAEFLSKQEEFSRIMWFPKPSRFGYYSNTHPAISAELFFDTSSPKKIVGAFSQKNSQERLHASAIEYVILPGDFEKEVFLVDRVYSQSLKNYYADALKKVSYLKPVKEFSGMYVYKVLKDVSHFYIENRRGELRTAIWEKKGPTSFNVRGEDIKKGEKLVFSEKFDRFWQATVDDKTFQSEEYAFGLTSFTMLNEKNYSLHIHYALEPTVFVGSGVSVVVLVACLIFLSLRWKKIL